jgi:hypothetical protein
LHEFDELVRVKRPRTNTTSEITMTESRAYVYIQLPDTLEAVPAALLKVTRERDGTYIGRFRYGDRYLERPNAVELDPFQLPLVKSPAARLRRVVP